MCGTAHRIEQSAERIAKIEKRNLYLIVGINLLLIHLGGIMVKFRFQDLKIWKLSIEIADKLFDIADVLEDQKLFKFSEQLRAAGLSMPNNIAEGSGSYSDKEFKNFLNIARRSTFENANMLIIFERRKLITTELLKELLDDLDKLCRQISNFRQKLS